MSRTLCSNCGAGRGVQTGSNLSYCHSCHKTIFNKTLIKRINKIESSNLGIPSDLIVLNKFNESKNAYRWLKQYYIADLDITNYNIYWSESLQRIIFLYNNYKSAWARSINKNIRNKWLHLGEKGCLYKYIACPIALGTKICTGIIVEDCISAIRVFQNGLTTFSLGGTNINNFNTIILNFKDKKLDYRDDMSREYRILTWFDGDRAGQIAAEKFRRRYKLYLNIKNIVTKKDPKCHTPSEMEEILNEHIK